VVSGDPHCFPDRGDPTGAGARRLGVGQCSLRVLVEQFAGRDEVASHGVSGGFVEGEKLGTYFGR
jgi:hypothetical protein